MVNKIKFLMLLILCAYFNTVCVFVERIGDEGTGLCGVKLINHMPLG